MNAKGGGEGKEGRPCPRPSPITVSSNDVLWPSSGVLRLSDRPVKSDVDNSCKQHILTILCFL